MAWGLEKGTFTVNELLEFFDPNGISRQTQSFDEVYLLPLVADAGGPRHLSPGNKNEGNIFYRENFFSESKIRGSPDTSHKKFKANAGGARILRDVLEAVGPTWLKKTTTQWYENNPGYVSYAIDPAQIRNQAGDCALTTTYLQDIKSFAASRGRNSSATPPPALESDLTREVQLYSRYFRGIPGMPAFCLKKQKGVI